MERFSLFCFPPAGVDGTTSFCVWLGLGPHVPCERCVWRAPADALRCCVVYSVLQMSTLGRKGDASAEASFTEAQILEFKEAFKLFDKVR